MATTAHATFVVERTLNAAPARVFAAWANPEAKARWFAGPRDKWTLLERTQDFRVGGREHVKGAFAGGGPVSEFDAQYLDIVPGERIVYSYDMHIDGKRISISLATIEIKPAGAGTKMTITEQGAFLDGYDDAGSRERGTMGLMDQLIASVDG